MCLFVMTHVAIYAYFMRTHETNPFVVMTWQLITKLIITIASMFWWEIHMNQTLAVFTRRFHCFQYSIAF